MQKNPLLLNEITVDYESDADTIKRTTKMHIVSLHVVASVL